MPITTTIITLNEQDHIAGCIRSAQSISDEILVVDSNSQDNTVNIAKQLGANVIIQPYLGDGYQKAFAGQSAQYDWILSLDADERITDEMASEIVSLDLANSSFDAYSFKRHTYIGHRWQKVWSPDRIVRLYNRTRCSYKPVLGHSSIDTKNTQKLNSYLLHYSYANFSDMASKINKFTYCGALAMYQNGKHVSVLAPAFKGLVAFIKKYLFKKGFLAGFDGLTISVFTGFNCYLKYAMLLEMRRHPEDHPQATQTSNDNEQ